MRVSSWFSILRVCAAGLLTLLLGLPVEAVAQAAAGARQPGAMPGGEGSMQAGGDAKPAAAGLQTRTAEGRIALIPEDQRYLLVLDRFTYGPRPGDVEKLQKMGLNAWFQQQLDPEKIDDSLLEAKLAYYPAMRLPLNKLMEMYPSNGLIRQSMNGKAGMPGGEAERAIYADQQAQYKAKKAKEKVGGDDADKGVASLPEAPEEILAMPKDKRFKELCHLSLAQLGVLRKALTPEQRLQLVDGFTPVQVEAIAAFNGPHNVVEAEDIQVKLLRDVYTERQLNEVMVDFWLNHFNVYMKKSQEAAYYITAYEREAIRPYALGSFENLLVATATSPAMLNYLDNSESVGPHSQYATGFSGGAGFYRRPAPKPKQTGLNENYAREVMELHTVGVNGGYTQKDVTELAKVFTGWTVGKGFRQDVVSVAEYDPAKHEPGTKVVMGMTIKENGQKEGIEVLKMLAASPQCARFISTKLAVRFVSDTPPPAMVERMTQTFLETHGSIRRVLLAMVNSPEFFTAGTYRAKLKTPQDFVVSAVRATGSDVESTAGMQQAIAELGMPLYGMQTPNGYSMKAEAWNSTTQLVSRMNFAMALASNRVAGMKTDPGALLGAGAAGTAEEKTKALEDALLHGPLSERTQKLILAQVTTDGAVQMSELKQVSAVNGKDPLRVGGPGRTKGDGGAMDTQASLATGLILGSPEFQRR